MILNGWKVCALASLCLGGFLAACVPEEDSGECNAAKPCTLRGEVCDEVAQECVVAALDVDATAEGDAPAEFTNVPLPFFRGKVCVATSVKPGDTVPVKISPCLHPCIAGDMGGGTGGYSFKKQYRCSGSSCESLVLVYFGKASGTGCPADAFGKFDRSQCVYTDYDVSAGPFSVSSGPVSGLAKVEVPFLSNDDIAALLPLEMQTDTRVAKTWELAYQYPPDPDRVFDVTLSAGSPSAPADCADESKCDCREIGF